MRSQKGCLAVVGSMVVRSSAGMGIRWLEVGTVGFVGSEGVVVVEGYIDWVPVSGDLECGCWSFVGVAVGRVPVQALRVIGLVGVAQAAVRSASCSCDQAGDVCFAALVSCRGRMRFLLEQ